MDTKTMGACKEALFEQLSILYGLIECEKKYSWCASDTVFEGYKAVYNSILSYRHTPFLPKKVTLLPFDFVCEERKLIVEYDERQHFTHQRKLALVNYPNWVQLNYDKQTWIDLCDTVQASMNKKTDPYRDEKRALYDSIRDNVTENHGYKLIRLYHGQVDFEDKNVCDTLQNLVGI